LQGKHWSCLWKAWISSRVKVPLQEGAEVGSFNLHQQIALHQSGEGGKGQQSPTTQSASGDDACLISPQANLQEQQVRQARLPTHANTPPPVLPCVDQLLGNPRTHLSFMDR